MVDDRELDAEMFDDIANGLANYKLMQQSRGDLIGVEQVKMLQETLRYLKANYTTYATYYHLSE